MKAKLWVLLLGEVVLSQALGMDIDTGKDAVAAAKVIETAGSREQGAGNSAFKGWVRLRGTDLAKVPETRDALTKLHEQGLKTCVMLRWPAKDWKVTYLPKDLSEAHENGRKLGAAYGDLVDAWEIDNEPDLGFVPEAAERYAAFLKATYLGLQRGLTDAKAQRGQGKAQSAELFAPGSSRSATNVPLVLMGSLGLPPGPWLERFAKNDGFSYTDGFNYHYYGYPEDFSGVYRLQEAAVKELSVERYRLSGARTKNQELITNNLSQKNLPVFMTEIGYGMLGKEARDTKEGRLWQWRWFKSVGEQANNLRIEAPMAFYLQPYLEYDTSEFGLTVPAKPGAEKPETGDLRPEGWTAGGVEYAAEDFGAKSVEPWMKMIGKKIDGNDATPALAQWIALRARSWELGARSRKWEVSVPAPTPVVIDFLAGEGLSFVKRYDGSFVIGLTAGGEPRAKSEAKETKPPLPPSSLPSAPSRSEEFMVHVRTQNGNLYEVYPTRQATSDWQSYSESQGNFTMSFYGRAELPWRFKENKPASLVLVMYPKQLPATYEFKRVQLLKLGAGSPEQGASFRYGRGTVVLYNFSDKEVSGRITLPTGVERVDPNARSAESVDSASSVLKLLPGERREIPVTIKVPWGRFERIEAPVTFVPEDRGIPPARFKTAFMADIGGMKATVVAELLPESQAGSSKLGANRLFIVNRPRVTEEAPMTERSGFFAQQGATVERTTDGFTVTITDRPPGKAQRVEVEIPWAKGVEFTEDEFLGLDFRLKVERVDPNALVLTREQTTR